MKSFNVKPATKKAEVELYGKAYAFEVSPTNYEYMQRIRSMGRDIAAIVERVSGIKASEAEAVLKTYDSVYASEKEIAEFLFPGKFEEIFTDAGKDLLVMAQLIVFVIQQISEAFSSATIEQDVVTVPDGPGV